MKKSVVHLFAIVLLLSSSFAQAQLAIDRIIINFNRDSAASEDVILQNTSDKETLFIAVEVLEVSNPGSSNEQRIVIDDPARVGLIATPARVIIPPKGRKYVRLVNLLEGVKKDHIFRINFTPVTPRQQASESAVKLMIGYQALVMVRPDRPSVKINAQRVKDTVTVANNGNTNVFLEQMRQCRTSKLQECTPLNDQRLYAGNSTTISLKEKGPVVFDIFDGSTRTTRSL